MAHSILSLWLLVAALVPHACDKETPLASLTQGLSPTPVIQRKRPPIFNNQKFALSLYRQLPGTNKNKNIIFSPLSIAVPLTLLAFQNKPEARHLILNDLGFRDAKDLDNEAPMSYGNQLGALLRDDQCGIQTGSLLFMDKKLKPESKFLSLAQSAYSSDVILISLGDYELAHKQINSVMRDRTHGKVKRLLRDVKALSDLLLANYNFFKGTWKHRFDPKLTTMKYFTVHEGVRIMVPMMQRVGWFHSQYFSHLHSYVLQMPFTCNISGVFILPEEKKLEECEKAVLEESFDTWIQPLPLSMGRLFFPKFSIPVTLRLENFKYASSRLNLFFEHMDLSGITMPKAPLRVTTALHRVELTMDEDGAEEETISGFQGIPMPFLHNLNFNRPFLLLILEEASHNLLFMGKVVNPTSVRSVPKTELRT